MTAVFLSAFPVWLEKLKKQNKNNSFCLRIDDVGWYKKTIYIFNININNIHY